MADKKEKVENIEEVAETPEAEATELELTNEEQLQKQLDELNDKYLRLMAEFSNYQNRTQKEKVARYADAMVDAVAELLPVGDNLERALKTEVKSEDALKFKEGIEMVMKQFNDCLERLGVTPIEAEGQQFDPNFHNAVMHIEDESMGENVVAEDLMRGYIYKGERVIRHSMVIVAN